MNQIFQNNEYLNIFEKNQTPIQCQFMSLAERSRDFMRIARSIGKDIANTYTKLEKLTLLAKRKTIAFDDRPAEIQNLTFIIKEDMNQLNRQIGQVNIEFSYIYSLTFTGERSFVT